MQALTRLYREARRRKVFRTAALYVVGAWLTLQVADVLFPGFGIPDTAIQALVWAAVLGLPVALAFGWLFEIGPDGIRRTPPVDASALGEPQPLGRRDYLILAAFAVIALVLVVRAARDVRDAPAEHAAAGPAGGAAAAVERLANSIAVLPFANISSDPEVEYFCDGVAEEILQQLADFGELTVIGRTSSFAFKDSDYGIDRISALLGVQYVLQGSVRKAGDQLRVSAQLLDAGGVQVWSRSFDRQLANVFEIQSEIAESVAAIVARHVLPRPEATHQPKLEAYDHYLAGRNLLHARESARAVEELEQAVAIDPLFAEAHAELAIGRMTSESLKDLRGAVRASIDRALELRPRLLRAQAAQALWLRQQKDPDYAEIERVLRGVLEQDPNMSDALLWLSGALVEQGRKDESRALLERAARIDPLHPSITANLASRLYEDGEPERAIALLRRYIEQPRPGFAVYGALGHMSRATGRLDELLKLEQRSALLSSGPSYHGVALAYGLLGDFEQAERLKERLLVEAPESPGTRILAIAMDGWVNRNEQVLAGMRELLGDPIEPPPGSPPGAMLLPGAVLARAGDHASAIRLLEPLVDAADPGGTWNDGAPGLYALHALAWSYRHTGDEARARALLDSASRWCDELHASGRPMDSIALHRCAETEVLRGNHDRALAELERAIAAGWRDYYFRRYDAYWAPLQDDPRFRALMEKVRADVDRQRAEVQRLEASQGFIEQLEQARAQRPRSAPVPGGSG